MPHELAPPPTKSDPRASSCMDAVHHHHPRDSMLEGGHQFQINLQPRLRASHTAHTSTAPLLRHPVQHRRHVAHRRQEPPAAPSWSRSDRAPTSLGAPRHPGTREREETLHRRRQLHGHSPAASSGGDGGDGTEAGGTGGCGWRLRLCRPWGMLRGVRS